MIRERDGEDLIPFRWERTHLTTYFNPLFIVVEVVSDKYLRVDSTH